MQKAKVKKRGPRPWSEDEIKLLKRLYQDENVQSIADKLGRSLDGVSVKASKIGLKKQGARPWSNQEIRLLKKLYPSKTAQEIADQIGRPVQATRFRIFKLGLRKRRLFAKN